MSAHGAVPQRTLHLIDIENLTGGWPTRHAVPRLAQAYRHQVSVGEQDHVFAAFCPTYGSYGLYLPSWMKFRIGNGGVNGADDALLDLADDPTWVARRFRRVSIGSGDGIFADLAESLEAAGVGVTMVTALGRASKRLKRVCSSRLRLTFADHRPLWCRGLSEAS